jgi:hypothetical protein
MVQSGVLGADWAAEYDGLDTGWDAHLHTLAQYLKYFRGRTATPFFALASAVRGHTELRDGAFRLVGGVGGRLGGPFTPNV